MDDLIEEETCLLTELVKFLNFTGELKNISERFEQELKSISSTSSASSLAGSSTGSLNDSFCSFSSSTYPDGTGNQRLFNVKVQINVIQLADFNEDLAMMIMSEKKEFLEMLQLIIFRFSVTLEFGIKKRSQILLTPVITGLAPLYDHEVLDGKELNQIKSGHLMSATVMVAGLAATMKYVSSTSYLCTSTDCEDFRDEAEYVKVFSAVSESKEQFQCLRCEGKMEEQYRRRDVREVVPGLVWILAQGNVSRVLNVVFRQEEGARLELGQKVVIVFTVERARSGDLILEVISTDNCCPVNPPPAFNSKIAQLLQNREWSAWSFVVSLAYVFCENLVPTGAFLQLRLALLLSLVSDSSARLNVMAVGEEDLIFSRLMSEGVRMVEGGVYTSNVSLTGSVSKGSLSYLEAGLLHQARDSVLYLGDVLTLKPSVRESLVKTVETRSVSSPPPLTSSQPLTTALWAMASTSSVQLKRGDNSRLVSLLGNLQDFASCMDLVIVTSDSSTSLESGEIMASFFLDPPEEPNKISPDEISAYLAHVRQLKVRTTPDCQEFLQKYFLASRRVRPNCPQSAISTLLRTAIGHAKLACRSELTKEDCVFACHTFEDMMTSLTGYSYLGHNARDTFPEDCSLERLLGSGHESEMKEFQFNLERFLQEYSTGREKDWPATDEEYLSTEE